MGIRGRKAYFAALDLHYPELKKARITKWRKENPERVRTATRLRVARFRARTK